MTELRKKLAMIRTNQKLLIGAAVVGLVAGAMLWLAFNRGPLANITPRSSS
jgi:hypothetical protein